MKKKKAKHGPNDHSPVGASSRYRYKMCPGSVRESAKHPNISSKDADEGTRAHEWVANFIEQLKRGKEPDFSRCPEERGMRAAVKVAVDFVDNQMGNHPEVWVELPIGAPDIDEDAWGTADVILYHEKIKQLCVYDYKHGVGVFVPVENNLQLITYAIYAIKTLGLDVEEIEVGIIQPRIEFEDAIRTWTFNIDELPEMEFDLYNDIQATKKKNAPLVSGPHCNSTFCNARAKCPVLLEESNKTAAALFSSPNKDVISSQE